jgi:hypothetical protein
MIENNNPETKVNLESPKFLDYSSAVIFLKNNGKIRRVSWKNKKSYLIMIDGVIFLGFFGLRNFIEYKNLEIEDVLAKDWIVL